jgi:hypothetical protein
MFDRTIFSTLLTVAAINMTFQPTYADDPIVRTRKVAHWTVKIVARRV